LIAESLALQLRAKRSEMMAEKIEDVALRLFHARGFVNTTVDDIAAEMNISSRTFYRYFPTKEDIFQLQIDRRCHALQTALSRRPADEAPLHSVRIAFVEVVSEEDKERTLRWTEVIAATPTVVKAVIGGVQLKMQVAIAEFFAARLNEPDDSLVPTMLAAATGGIVHAAQSQWFIWGGDFTAIISDGLEVLERGIGTNPARASGRKKPRPKKRGSSGSRTAGGAKG
jgi:TetR/AcrR family transcriptional regulator, regulator of mycofactocin system